MCPIGVVEKGRCGVEGGKNRSGDWRRSSTMQQARPAWQGSGQAPQHSGPRRRQAQRGQPFTPVRRLGPACACTCTVVYAVPREETLQRSLMVAVTSVCAPPRNASSVAVARHARLRLARAPSGLAPSPQPTPCIFYMSPIALSARLSAALCQGHDCDFARRCDWRFHAAVPGVLSQMPPLAGPARNCRGRGNARSPLR